MNRTMVPQAAETFRLLEKEPLVPFDDRDSGPILDRQAIQGWLPHRDPFLFLDRVTTLDLKQEIIVARYSLIRSKQIFAGHFPDHPVWPAVLQVEAIGQAGLLLYLKKEAEVKFKAVAATHILGTRFMRPVPPAGEVEIQARIFEDGLFETVVGQCSYRGQICSIAAVNFLGE